VERKGFSKISQLDKLVLDIPDNIVIIGTLPLDYNYFRTFVEPSIVKTTTKQKKKLNLDKIAKELVDKIGSEEEDELLI